MNKLEIIRRIVEEKPDIEIDELLGSNKCHCLLILCVLNKKYLSQRNLNYILENRHLFIRYKFNNSNEITYSYLTLLLSTYPKLFDKLHNNIISEIEHIDWIKIILNQPSLIEKCKIKNDFDLDDWVKILKKQPQLVIKYKDFYHKIDENSAIQLITSNKDILNYIDITKIKFDVYCLRVLLSSYPEIINKLDEDTINKIPTTTWLNILENDYNLINICPKSAEIDKSLFYKFQNSIIKLVSKQPNFNYLLPSTDKISNDMLVTIIINQPTLIEELKIDLRRFKTENWIKILEYQPHLVDKCDKLNNISRYTWARLLAKQPILLNHCDKLDKFDDGDWHHLLKARPELIEYCNSDLNIEIKSNLLLLHPILIEKLSLNGLSKSEIESILYHSKEHRDKVIEKYVEKFHDIELLTNMIGIYPDLKDLYIKKDLWKYVDFSKLTNNIEYSILR